MQRAGNLNFPELARMGPVLKEELFDKGGLALDLFGEFQSLLDFFPRSATNKSDSAFCASNASCGGLEY